MSVQQDQPFKKDKKDKKEKKHHRREAEDDHESSGAEDQHSSKKQKITGTASIIAATNNNPPTTVVKSTPVNDTNNNINAQIPLVQVKVPGVEALVTSVQQQQQQSTPTNNNGKKPDTKTHIKNMAPGFLSASLFRSNSTKRNQDVFSPRDHPASWKRVLVASKFKDLALTPLKTNKGTMFKLSLGKGDFEVIPPPLKVRVSNLHGIGTLSKESKEGDPGRKFKSTYVVLESDEGAAEKNLNLNDMDREILKQYPHIGVDGAKFYEIFNGPFLDRIIQLFVFETSDSKELDAKIVERAAQHKLQLKAKELTYARTLIQNETIESLLDTTREDYEEDHKIYAEILRELIEVNRVRFKWWYNKGSNNSQSDADMKIKAIRTSCKAFWLKQRASDKKDEDSSSGTTNNNKNEQQMISAANISTKIQAKPVEAVKSLESTFQEHPQQENEADDNDFIPEDLGFNVSKKQVNEVCKALTGAKGEYRYNKLRYFTPDMIEINRAGKPAHDQFMYANDYATPVFKVLVCEVQTTVHVILSHKHAIFYKEGLRRQQMDENEYREMEQQTYTQPDEDEHQHQQTNIKTAQLPGVSVVVGAKQ